MTIRKSFLPLKNVVRAREISEFDEYSDMAA